MGSKTAAKFTSEGAPEESERPLSFIDIFAGCGGLSLGLLQAGWQGLFAIEKDPNAFRTLAHNLTLPSSSYRFSWPNWLPKMPHDVELVLQNFREKLEEISGCVDLVAGGPPCQGFSTAGRRDANDPRNKLVETYLKFVATVRPRLVLIENVRGITADFRDEDSPQGKINYAGWLISSLSKDYHVSSQIVDTSLFGVPQRRKRFFVIAVRRDLTNGAAACPFQKIDGERMSFLRSKGLLSVPVGAKRAISDFEVMQNGTITSRDCPGFEDISYRRPRTAYQKLMNAGVVGIPQDTRLARHKPKIVARFEQIIEICNADGRLNTSLSPEVRASFGLRKCAIRVMDPDRPSPTVTSMPDDMIHYSEPRTLTVRENARLQGFPDWFAFKGKYTTGGDRRRKEVPRFTQVANAVPPLVAEAIGRAMTKYLTSLASQQR